MGGGIVAVFSTYEKAEEYANIATLGTTETCQIIGLTIDDSDRYDCLDYCRHGITDMDKK